METLKEPSPTLLRMVACTVPCGQKRDEESSAHSDEARRCLRTEESTSCSVRFKRLQRIGATANLLNLLQKQHPADLAELFGELPYRDRSATFKVLVDQKQPSRDGGPERARPGRGRLAPR